ncbi:MAG: TraR/DksA C4-type zinc finger protein [Caldilineaceae bacterium]|nr:TraR/DksA C4-type zinc finger protein [Caldilineaceae bacterium]MCB0096093.1 TraR/DksA C4-type zinc finger protein [Caldilineaceae bacterium]MCB0140843.1 TraR/DksA C4-type zinc finger protein [Caldilineaceae bacterium]
MQQSKELTQIRQLLEEKRNQLIASLKGRAEAGDGSHLRNLDRTDLANDYRSKDRQTALHSMDQQLLDQVEQALARLKDGSYGECVECGQPINPQRLEILPYATLCIECQEKIS